MDELRDSAALSIWDEEGTASFYALPLPSTAPQVQNLWHDIPEDQLYFVSSFKCAKSPQSHIGPFRWAIDFLVPDGTPVLAACDGVVTEVKDDSNQWGDSPEFQNHLNFITIRHLNGEFTQYCHLAAGSARVNGLENGVRVSKGQRIATVSKSGWTDRDHLHFIVFRSDSRKENPFGFKSLRIRFTSSAAEE